MTLWGYFLLKAVIDYWVVGNSSDYWNSILIQFELKPNKNKDFENIQSNLETNSFNELELEEIKESHALNDQF